MERKSVLGVELGSTRIKAVVVDGDSKPVSAGDYTWRSKFENGIWTYDLDEVWTGLKSAIGRAGDLSFVASAGISAMMHGYLAFDKDWNLLVPFRTWQNTITAKASSELTHEFGFNIPQRWSIAHLYQAILNGEEHVGRIAHITTLAGYVHYSLTGVNAVGIGEASGMFPVDEKTKDYDAEMLKKFDSLIRDRKLPWQLRDILPDVLCAGECAGTLTEEGALKLGGLLPAGIPFAPPEGDAGTGMVATNSVSPRTGNVSAGTSIFSMVVLEQNLKSVHEAIDVVATPEGAPVAMVHCNNCTNDFNAWVDVFKEVAELLGKELSDEIFEKLYLKSLEGEPDCGGTLVCNYMAGESVTGLDSGRPLITRNVGSNFTLANLLRASLYSALVTLRIGMDELKKEDVAIDSLVGHGGFFKTPGVGQRYLSAACNAPVTCLETAGEGGPYGMALLASFMINRSGDETLGDFLKRTAFSDVHGVTITAEQSDIQGFNSYLDKFKRLLVAEKIATEVL